MEQLFTKLLDKIVKTKEGALILAGFLIAVLLYLGFTVEGEHGTVLILKIIGMIVVAPLIPILIVRGRGKSY